MDALTKYVGRASNPRNSTGSQAYNALYVAMRLNATYLQIGGPSAEKLIYALGDLGFAGLTVVGQYSESVLPFLTDLDSHAERVGAVNAVQFRGCRRTGFKTDGPAALEALGSRVAIGECSFSIIGAGRLARELCISLIAAGARSVRLYSRSAESRRSLVDAFGIDDGGGLEDVSRGDADVLINASPIGSLGCEDSSIPGLPNAIDGTQLVMDASFRPWLTQLVVEARTQGIETITGLEWFARQGQRQVEIYLDVKPDLEILTGLLRLEFG